VKLVYHPHFLFGSRMLNCFHPFEFNRAELALKRVEENFGSKLEGRVLRPTAPLTFEELAFVHDVEYLKSLERNLPVTQVIEVPWLSVFPRSCIENWFVDPALWSVAGSLLAARTALEEGGCLSLGGGFHHAKRTGGEGFCLFSDIAFVIETLRGEGALSAEDGILYVDLDVHQGDGTADIFSDDIRVFTASVHADRNYPHVKQISDYDLGLPDGSGADLIRELAAASPRIPVILGTSGDDFSEELAVAAGADGFLRKPITSLVRFQEHILSLLPPERQPLGPRPLNEVEVIPDRIAYQDDMAHIAGILCDATDERSIDYVGQFLSGVARIAHDQALRDAADRLIALRRKGQPTGSQAAHIAGLVQDRLTQRAAM